MEKVIGDVMIKFILKIIVAISVEVIIGDDHCGHFHAHY